MKYERLIPPALNTWEKHVEPVAHHEWGDDYDDVYTFSPCKGIEYRIWHEEEEYGNDTHGWQCCIVSPEDTILVTHKELTAEKAWLTLTKWNFRFLLPKTKTQLEAETRLKNLREKCQRYIMNNHVYDTRTSEFIGCPKCGSKLKRTLLRNDYCPLCKTDLRSQTVQETIDRYQSKIRTLQKKVCQ